MWTSVTLPEMPQIKDFREICEDPEWVAREYGKALAAWEKVCSKFTEALHMQAASS